MLVWFIATIASFILAWFFAHQFYGTGAPGQLRPYYREEIEVGQFSLLGLSAFIASFICSLFTLGMGYGTTITPMLIILGFGPLQIVPVVLLSQFTIGAIGGFLHHRVGNVNFQKGSMHTQVASILAACSVVGTIVAVLIAVNISREVLTTFIAILVIAVGFTLLITLRAHYGFSYVKIIILGVIAAFNKGLSGGGYGPVVTGGQMLSGLEGRNAVGITFFAEGITCLIGVIFYILLHEAADFSLAPPMILGGVVALPFSTWIVKRMTTTKLRIVIGVVVIILGCWALWTVRGM
jgi:hypothetical protein